MKIHTIFPTAIATGQYENFSSAERENLIFNTEYKDDPMFSVSTDTRILDKVPHLKQWIKEQLDVYASDVMRIENKLKITQSWCLIHSDRPQFVFPHRHSNSIVSGSFYVEAPLGTRGLT